MTLRQVAPPNVPEITIGVDLQRMTDDAIAALAKSGQRIYQRSGHLVHVVRTVAEPSTKAAVRRARGLPTMKPLAGATLRERLSSDARWLKFDGRAKKHVQTLPPESVISACMARGEWGGIAPLVGVITAPTMRTDGSILQTPGYDEATGLLYWHNADYIKAKESPTLDEAKKCADQILKLVEFFPFAGPEHRSAWLAGVLSIVGRAAIDGNVPAFAVDGTTRGVGKGKLVDAAVRLALGHDASKTSQPDDEDEFRKRITSLVIEGDPCIVIDNVAKPLGSAALDAVLTTTMWKDRVLGASAMISAPNRGIYWITGNNLLFKGDLSRRVIRIRLESEDERPEERDGLPDIRAIIDQNRHKLVVYALLILRAFVVAGSPMGDGKIWGSFEEWSRLVPASIRWLGLADPMLARATEDESLDTDRVALARLHAGLLQLDPMGMGLTSRGVIDLLYPSGREHERGAPDGYEDFRDAIESVVFTHPGRPPQPTKLGSQFRKFRGRIITDASGVRRKLEAFSDRTNVSRWRVVKA